VTLAELRIHDVRCIESAILQLEPELNLIIGQNGAGKTSILEAAYLLGRGRSFRTRNNEKLIRQGATSLTVFGSTGAAPPETVGIEVSRAGSRARVNGRDAETLLELSGVLPVQSIDPEIHKLIDQGPERRRRWLDWLVFHVEPTFVHQWSRYQRALKQRNAGLRAEGGGFRAWDPQLIEHGEAITEARRRTMEALQPYLRSMFDKFAGLDVDATFFSGWSQEQSLEEALRQNADRDRTRAVTTGGPHRADVMLRFRQRSARETLSRGQQKLTAVAMVISQLRLLQSRLNKRALLLLDDPAAELDANNLKLLFDELRSLECQMIATSLSPEIALFQTPKATFHVEQGRVLRL
jgi:DNA replication and repair protein RecF